MTIELRYEEEDEVHIAKLKKDEFSRQRKQHVQRGTKKRGAERQRGRQIKSALEMAVIGGISQKPKPNAN